MSTSEILNFYFVLLSFNFPSQQIVALFVCSLIPGPDYFFFIAFWHESYEDSDLAFRFSKSHVPWEFWVTWDIKFDKISGECDCRDICSGVFHYQDLQFAGEHELLRWEVTVGQIQLN